MGGFITQFPKDFSSRQSIVSAAIGACLVGLFLISIFGIFSRFPVELRAFLDDLTTDDLNKHLVTVILILVILSLASIMFLASVISICWLNELRESRIAAKPNIDVVPGQCPFLHQRPRPPQIDVQSPAGQGRLPLQGPPTPPRTLQQQEQQRKSRSGDLKKTFVDFEAIKRCDPEGRLVRDMPDPSVPLSCREWRRQLQAWRDDVQKVFEEATNNAALLKEVQDEADDSTPKQESWPRVTGEDAWAFAEDPSCA